MVRAKLVAGMRRMTAIARQWAMRIGVALAAAFTAAIWAATKFEEQMANVSTMLTKKTMPAMRGFEKGIKRLAVAYGQSTETLSKGLYDILSASISAGNAIGVLEVSARAAIAGLTDTATAVDVITTVINSYAMSARDAEEVADALFATVKAGKLTFQELSQYLGMVAAPAAAAGLKLESLLAALATLTRAGVKPRIAITYLRQAVMAFSKSTPDAMRAAEQFGFTLETNTLRTIDLIGVLKKLEHASAEQVAAIFSSNEAFNAMITLRGDMIGHEKDLIAQTKKAGSMTEAFGKMAKTAAQWLRRMKQGIVIMAADIGKMFLPAMKAMSKAILDNQEDIKYFVYNVMARAWNKLLDTIAVADTVINNWSKTWTLVMDTASFAAEQFVADVKHYFTVNLPSYFRYALTLMNAARKDMAESMGTWLLERENALKHSLGLMTDEEYKFAQEWIQTVKNTQMHMTKVMLEGVTITKRVLSAEDKAIKKSLAGRWADWSKDLAKRSKKYDKFRAVIWTKEMRALMKQAEYYKSIWDHLLLMYSTWQEAKTAAALKGADDRKEIAKKEGEWVSSEEIWKRFQLAALGADIKAPTIKPEAPERIQQSQLTALQRIEKAGKDTASWLKKIFEKEPGTAALQ